MAQTGWTERKPGYKTTFLGHRQKTGPKITNLANSAKHQTGIQHVNARHWINVAKPVEKRTFRESM